MSVRLVFICWLLVGTGLFAQSTEESPDESRHRALTDLARADRILATDPQNAEALATRAGAATSLGARTVAYSSINRLEEIAPEHPRLSEWREALQLINPESTDIVLALAAESAAALAEHQTQAAADLLRVAELILPDVTVPGFGPWTLHVIRGDSLAADGHADLARADYEQAKGPDGKMTAEAHVALGRLLVNSGDFDGALTSLAAVPADAGQDFVFARYWKAKALAARYGKSSAEDDAKQAYQIFSALADADPNDEDYAKERDAVRDLAAARNGPRLSLSAVEALAQVKTLHANGQDEDARRKLDLLLLRHPRLADGYALRAQLARDDVAARRDAVMANLLRNPPAAPSASNTDPLAAANHAVAQRPYASEPYIQRARLLLEQKDADSTRRALDDARMAVTVDAYDPQAHAALAEALAARNRHVEFIEFRKREQNLSEAMAVADQAVALAPEDASLLEWRGDFVAAHGWDISQRPAQAMRFYTQALRFNPTSTKILLKRAQAAGQADREAEAITDYREILRLTPGHTSALYELGVNQLSLARFTDAVATFEALQPQFPLQAGETTPESIEIAQLAVVARAGAGENSADRAQLLLNRAPWSQNAGILLSNLRQRKSHSRELDRLAQLKPATP